MLTDAQRRGKRNQKLGARFEDEVAAMERAAGFKDAWPNVRSGALGGADLRNAIPDTHQELKAQGRNGVLQLSAALKQARAAARPTDTIWIVHAGLGQPVQVSIELSEIIGALAGIPQLSPVVATHSIRPVFLEQYHRSNKYRRPAVIHPLDGIAWITLLLEDLLVPVAAIHGVVPIEDAA